VQLQHRQQQLIRTAAAEAAAPTQLSASPTASCGGSRCGASPRASRQAGQPQLQSHAATPTATASAPPTTSSAAAASGSGAATTDPAGPAASAAADPGPAPAEPPQCPPSSRPSAAAASTALAAATAGVAAGQQSHAAASAPSAARGHVVCFCGACCPNPLTCQIVFTSSHIFLLSKYQKPWIINN